MRSAHWGLALSILTRLDMSLTVVMGSVSPVILHLPGGPGRRA